MYDSVGMEETGLGCTQNWVEVGSGLVLADKNYRVEVEAEKDPVRAGRRCRLMLTLWISLKLSVSALLLSMCALLFLVVDVDGI